MKEFPVKERWEREKVKDSGFTKWTEKYLKTEKILLKIGKFKRAFTLIEIMVVVLIIGLMAGLVGINVIRYFERAKERTAKAQLKMLEQALELYRLEHGRYPTTDEGLKVLVEGKYLKTKKLPKDPWGNDYYYISDGKTYTLKSVGKDGTPGTEDDIIPEEGEKGS